jgi:hypothetical protein
MKKKLQQQWKPRRLMVEEKNNKRGEEGREGRKRG